MTRSRQMRRRPRGAGRRISRATVNHARLPQIQVVPTTNTVMRFQNGQSQVGQGAQSIISVTTTNLCAAMGVFATTTHSASTIWGACKLKKIEIWGIGFTAGTGQTFAAPSVAIRWNQSVANQANTNSTDTDSSLSSAFPAYLNCRPPAGTSASFWNNSNQNQTLFQIIYQGVESMFIDVHVDMRLNDDTFSSASSTYTTTFSVGNIYYPNLDGVGGVFNRCILPNAF